MDLEDRFVEAMADLDCTGGRRCLIALSGGGDSTALLELCSRTITRTGNYYIALRVRHDIRESAVEEAETEFCSRICSDRDIEFHTVGAGNSDSPEEIARESGCGPEQAAREFRHRLIDQARIRYHMDCVLFAHTLDDDRETLLMRFFRGSGPEGLKGIPGIRDSIRRPLLKVKGRELRDYLRNHGVLWHEDATNAENDYLRNKVRNRLIPVLDDIFPGWSTAADNLISRSAEASTALSSAMEKELRFRSEPGRVIWDREDWDGSSGYIRALALLAGINHLQTDEESDTRIPWTLVRELRNAGNLKQSRDTGGFRLDCTSGTISLGTAAPDWKGRMVFESLESLTDEKNRLKKNSMLHISTTGPGYPVAFQAADFPLEIAWEPGKHGFELRIITWKQPEKRLTIGSEDIDSTLTEKSSVTDRSDADNEIVYIQISHNTESEGSNARGQKR